MCLSVVAEAEADVLEEDVFQEEAVSCLLSPLHSESIDFPESPVSLHAFTLNITISTHFEVIFKISPIICSSL